MPPWAFALFGDPGLSCLELLVAQAGADFRRWVGVVLVGFDVRSFVAVLVIIQPEIWFQLTDFGSCAIASHHVALILPQPFSAYTRIQDDTSTRHQVHLPREQPQEQA